jgi:4'-phosphopantetheinyl transferase
MMGRELTIVPGATTMQATLPADRIDVWTWRLSVADIELTPLIQLLSVDERARVSRLAFAQDQTQFIVARAGLRQILATYLALPAGAIKFSYGEHGKPALSQYQSAPFFNLTHSGEFAAVAVTRCGEVGIDIEQIRPVGPEIALRFFSEGEKATLAPLSGSEWLEAFYKCWTRKEAVLKANGKGLAGGLTSYDVLPARDATVWPLRVQGGRSGSAHSWSIQDLPLVAGFIGAIAVRTASVPPPLRHFGLDWVALASCAVDPAALEHRDVTAQGHTAHRNDIAAS